MSTCSRSVTWVLLASEHEMPSWGLVEAGRAVLEVRMHRVKR